MTPQNGAGMVPAGGILGRHLLTSWVILFAGALLPRCTCNPIVLTPIGDGDTASTGSESMRDAGPVVARGDVADDGLADAGPIDGGAADEGGVTFTHADAGELPACFVPRITFDFTCEGDEDICDPEGDVEVPEQDIVATWSRYEGDEFVVDTRFRGMPFTVGLIRWLFYVSPDPFSDAGVDGSEVRFPEGYMPSYLSAGLEIGLNSTPISYVPPFPPFVAVPLPQTALLDPCTTYFLAVDQPAAQVRLPLPSGSTSSYFEMTERERAGDDDDGGISGPGSARDPDYLFAGTHPQTLTSRGGAPDVPPTYRSICDITCEDVGGVTQ